MKISREIRKLARDKDARRAGPLEPAAAAGAGGLGAGGAGGVVGRRAGR